MSENESIGGEYPMVHIGRIETEEIIKKAGWDNAVEFLLDISSYFIRKPANPSIAKDDIDALDEDALSSVGMTANQYEEDTVDTLEAKGFSHLVEPFKQQMQEYRKGVKAIVQLWRDSGLL